MSFIYKVGRPLDNVTFADIGLWQNPQDVISKISEQAIDQLMATTFGV